MKSLTMYKEDRQNGVYKLFDQDGNIIIDAIQVDGIMHSGFKIKEGKKIIIQSPEGDFDGPKKSVDNIIMGKEKIEDGIFDGKDSHEFGSGYKNRKKGKTGEENRGQPIEKK